MPRAKRRPTSAKRWWSLPGCNRRRTTWSWICRTPMIASWRRFRPRRPKPSWSHVRAFAYFGGVPTRILYDNTKIAVAKILGGEERQRTRAFSELQSYYLFADKFGRPAKGNDKGKVEGLVGYARRN